MSDLANQGFIEFLKSPNVSDLEVLKVSHCKDITDFTLQTITNGRTQQNFILGSLKRIYVNSTQINLKNIDDFLRNTMGVEVIFHQESDAAQRSALMQKSNVSMQNSQLKQSQVMGNKSGIYNSQNLAQSRVFN